MNIVEAYRKSKSKKIRKDNWQPGTYYQYNNDRGMWENSQRYAIQVTSKDFESDRWVSYEEPVEWKERTGPLILEPGE